MTTMATLGQLIIAVQTSGVADARKQLEELDKLASSVGKKKDEGKKDDAGAKAEMDAARKMHKERLGLVEDFHNRDLNMHATNLSKMVDNEAKAWGRIAKIREKASESTGFKTGTERVAPGGGGAEGGGESTGGGGGAGSTIRGLLGNSLRVGYATIGAEVAASFAQGAAIGTLAGFSKAFEGVPILGQAHAAGRNIGKFFTGQLQEEADQPHIERARETNLRARAFTQTNLQNEAQAAQIEFQAATKRLELASKNGEISDENYANAVEAEDRLADARVKNAKFERGIQLESAALVEKNIRAQVGSVTARAERGELAGQITGINAQRDAQLSVLEIEIQRAKHANDPAMVKALQAQQREIVNLSLAQIELLKIEEKRAVTRINASTTATQAFASGVSGATEEEMKALAFTRQRAEVVAEIARIQSMPVDETQKAQLNAAKAGLQEIEAIEKRRLSIASTMAGLRVSSQTAAIAELGFAMSHQTVAAADARDEEEARQKIAAIRLRGGPMAAQEIVNEMEIADAKKALRHKELEETKSFMSAETAIQAKVNSGSITELDSRIRMIREKARQQAILHPEMAKEIQERAKQDEISAIRAGTQVRSVGAREANLLAFQGGRRMQEPAQKVLAPPSESPGLLGMQQKQIDALEQIVQNTAQQQYGRAAP